MRACKRAKKRRQCGTLSASSLTDAPSYHCNPQSICYHSRPDLYEETRVTPVRRVCSLPGRAGFARSIGRPERDLSQSVHDVATGRKTRAREPVQSCPRQVSVCGDTPRAVAQGPFRLATGDRRISRPESERKHPTRSGQSFDPGKCKRAGGKCCRGAARFTTARARRQGSRGSAASRKTRSVEHTE